MLSLERKARNLADKYLLQYVDIRILPKSVVAHAIPHVHHPKVDERRIAAFKEHEGLGLSLQQVMGITTDAMKTVATGTGKDIDEALFDLEIHLRTQAS